MPPQTDATSGESAGRRHGFRIAVCGIVLLAACLRIWSLDFGLPHPLTRPDEMPIVHQTLKPARGEFDLGWPLYPSAYIYVCWAWGSAGARVAHVLGLHPAPSYRAALRRDSAHVLLILRTLSAAAGTLAVLLLMLMCRRPLGEHGALVAGVLLATSFLHVRDSHTFKPDVVLSLGVVACLAAMLPLARRATWRSGAVAGAAAGAATSLKYPGVILFAPVYVAAVLGAARQGWRRFVSIPPLTAGVVGVVVFIASSPFLLFNPESRDVLESVLAATFPGLDSGGETAPGAAGPAASLLSTWLGGLRYHATISLRYGAGLLPALFAPIALAWGLASRQAAPLLASILTIVYFAVIALTPSWYARYATPVLPALALVEAGALVAITGVIRGRRRGIALALATAVLAAGSFTDAVRHDRLAARTDTRVLATAWLAERIPAESRIAILGTVFWPWGAPQIPPGLDVFRGEPTPEAMTEASVDYMLTHDHTLFSSTVDPEIVQALEPRLKLLAEFDPDSGTGDVAIFEERDAYYLPIHGFGAVTRGGPRIRIYTFE